MLKISRYTHFFEKGNLVWQALTKKIFYASSKTFAVLKENQGCIRTDWPDLLGGDYLCLLNDGFLTSDEQDRMILAAAKEKSIDNQLKGLYLIIASVCNLVCDYCFYSKQSSQSLQQTKRLMPADIAIKAINLFAELTAKNQRDQQSYWEQITFYGGEPLLNLQCIKAALDHVRRQQRLGKLWPHLSLVVNTNGTIITDEFLRLAQSENLSLQISIDGPADIHNIHRKSKSGKGTFGEVITNIKRLLAAGVEVVPVMTITDESIDHLAEFVDYLADQCQIKEFSANLLISGTRTVSDQYASRVAKTVYAIHQDRKDSGVADSCFVSTWQGFSNDEIAHSECGGSRKLTVFPEGTLHVCQSLEKTGLTGCGTLDQPEMNNPQRQLWLRRNRFDHPTCLKCPVIANCGGGCGTGSFHCGADINAIDPIPCLWTQTLFKLWIDSLKSEKID